MYGKYNDNQAIYVEKIRLLMIIEINLICTVFSKIERNIRQLYPVIITICLYILNCNNNNERARNHCHVFSIVAEIELLIHY